MALAPDDRTVTAAIDTVAKAETAAGVTAFVANSAAAAETKAKAEAARVEKQRASDEA